MLHILDTPYWVGFFRGMLVAMLLTNGIVIVLQRLRSAR